MKIKGKREKSYNSSGRENEAFDCVEGLVERVLGDALE